MPKKVRPRRAFALEEDGYIWVDYTHSTATEAREEWCKGTGLSWKEWCKKRPGLRIIRVIVAPEAPQ